MKDFKKLASQLSALDNEVKLRIIALLTERGSCSITDISKELKLNFSTTHKYLEQLEKAGFLKSDTVLKNRLKRLFYVKDFEICISPRDLVESREQIKPAGKLLKVISSSGEVRIFNIRKILDKYLAAGIPLSTIEVGAKILEEKAYDGITTLELEEIFEEFLRNKIASISSSLTSLSKLNPVKRTYADVLKLLYPEALVMHKKGDIFIESLGAPRLLNFSHDFFGICTHGLTGKQPKTLVELFKQLEFVLSKISNFTSDRQAINSFNYAIVPMYTQASELKEFILKLNQLGIQFYINLDVGEPRYLKDSFKMNDAEIIKYNNIAEQITKEVLLICAKNKLNNLHLVLKFWEDKIPQEVNLINTFFAVNMRPEWQTLNACYVGDLARYDMNWKKGRETRVGELQNMYINLPRLALKAKNKQEFFDLLKDLFFKCETYLFAMLEIATSEFFREYIIEFSSVRKSRWRYSDVFDSRYSLVLFGLTEAIALLKVSEKDSISFGEKLCNFCSEVISKFKIPARIELKVKPDQHLSNRFYVLDKQAFEEVGLPDYHIGAKAAGIKYCFHKYLRGGHCRILKREELPRFLEQKCCGQVKINS